MTHQIYTHLISKEAFFKDYPTLYYGTDGKWFAVVTADEKVCALALTSFPDYQRLTKRYGKHTLIEKRVHLGTTLSCLLPGTSFQHQVWRALLDIPPGSTWTYQQLATYVQKPKAVRAVANAVGANPISLLIPCHRVIRSDGSLGGYFWGVSAKRVLLQEENPQIFYE